MRLAVISDTHLGDPLCQLAAKADGKYVPGPRLPELERALDPGVDYLVLIGDILDFSMASYEEVYEAAKVFFGALAGKVKNFVYVPGNHDFDVWTTVEYQVNIINRLNRGKSVRPFRWTVPAVFDDRPDRRGRQVLPTVDPSPGDTPYGGLFLDALGAVNGEQRSRFIFAYPNAYLVTKEGRLIMMTHGHYFEGYWSALIEVAQAVIREDLRDPAGRTITHPTLEQMVAVNFPLCQLSCSGVGQAGPLSGVIDEIVAEVKLESRHKPLTRTRRYLDNAIDYLDEHTQIGGWLLDRLDVDERLMGAVKKALVKKLSGYEAVRHRIPFLRDGGTRERFLSYFQASLTEIMKLNAGENSCRLPAAPDYMIFGHTHRPVRWDPTRPANADYDYLYADRTVKLFNTGAWINRDMGSGTAAFSGAEVFVYDTDDPYGMTSVAIGSEAAPGVIAVTPDGHPVRTTDPDNG